MHMLVIEKPSDIDTHARHLIRLVRGAHSQSGSAVQSQLLKVANEIESEIGLLTYPDGSLQTIIDKLRLAAALEVDFACPWAHLRSQLEHKTTQLAVANALWDFNTHLSTEWTIPLEEFAGRVWGDDEKRTRTIRTSVSKFRKFLAERGIQLEVTIHDRVSLHRIDCKLL